MSNVRVFQLARDLGIPSQEVIDRLKRLGFDVKTASSSLDEDAADKLKRSVKIESFTAKKKRVYGSEEDENEREQAAEALAAKIAAEREERERAAAAAKAAAEARRAGPKTKAARAEAEKAAKAAAPEEPALTHAPGAPRLAPRVVMPVALPEDEDGELAWADGGPDAPETASYEQAASAAQADESTLPPRAAAPAASAAALTPTPRPMSPISAPPVPVMRPIGNLRPIAPPAPPMPRPAMAPRPAQPAATPAPAATASATMAAAPAATTLRQPGTMRPLRPIAPPRPIGPHPTSATSPGMARSPQPTRPGMSPLPARPLPPRPGSYPGASRPSGRPAPRKQERDRIQAPRKEERPTYSGPLRKVFLTESMTIKDIAEKMEDVKSRDLMKNLIGRGIMATLNQTLEPSLIVEVGKEFGYDIAFRSFEEEVVESVQQVANPEDLSPRAPVVTVMGHVDHGKTSLLDAIRETSVASGEAGGITQHIGAYHVDVGQRKVVFLDTPGHEAFTLMRARGAKVTDIVVLVVAADDGMMPQTVEAIDHAKAAGVPIIVAVNKIDKPEAQPDRVKQQLADKGLLAEDWGGTTVFVNVSAKKRQNLEQLLEMILLVADIQDLKANPNKTAVGTVLEARLDKGRGPVATILIQDGTLNVGDTIVAGAVSGKVRALVDDQGRRLERAGPSTPAEVLGLAATPEPGDQILVVTDAVKAQSITSFRQLKIREKALAATRAVKLEDLSKAIADGQLKELPIVLKGDVQGSVEAVTDQLMKIPQEKIRLRVIRSGVGAITESDVLLATASGAVVIGFNVRPERKATEIAERDKVEIRLHTVIYDVVDEMKKALEGLLEPTIREVRLGSAEVRDVFRISKVGTIAGCMVVDGRVTRTARVRLLRDNVVIHTGTVASLKRFKDDASEVKNGLECGIGIANYNDLKPGDVIEFFTTEKVKETL